MSEHKNPVGAVHYSALVDLFPFPSPGVIAFLSASVYCFKNTNAKISLLEQIIKSTRPPFLSPHPHFLCVTVHARTG